MFEGIETSGAEIMTAEQRERVQIPGKSTELVRGRLVVREPPGTFHGNLSARLLMRLGRFAEANDLGEVFAQDTGFRIASDPDTVRAPDVAFVARDRLAAVASRGYAPLAPDLVTEILSPDDRPGDVIAKVAEWLAAGVKLAWVIDPDRRTARVYRPDGSVTEVERHGALDGEAVLPGFRCRLSDLYRD
jgi:Uma2 family endonuclease